MQRLKIALAASESLLELVGIATGAEVNVNADWNATSGDVQLLNKPDNANTAVPGLMSAEDMTKLDGMLDRHGYLSVDLVPENVVLLDASGRIPMAKMPNNMVTYTSDQNNNIAYNINPSLRISGGGNTELGSAVEDFVVSNIAIVDVIIATVIEAINTHESAMQAAVPIGTMCDVEW